MFRGREGKGILIFLSKYTTIIPAEMKGTLVAVQLAIEQESRRIEHI